jgi:hypothetical protein
LVEVVMASYCAEADVYAAVRSESIPNEARLCASALAGSDVFELDQHGLATDDPVTFRAEDGGALPDGIDEGTTYYAIRLSASRFQVAETEGGAAVSLTSDGDLVLVVREMPMARWISWASAEVDQMLVGHVVEVDEDAVPTLVRAVTAKLAGYQARVWAGRDAGDLADLLDTSRKQLERWAKGVPVRGTNAPAPANLAVARSAATVADPRGWSPSGGTLP